MENFQRTNFQSSKALSGITGFSVSWRKEAEIVKLMWWNILERKCTQCFLMGWVWIPEYNHFCGSAGFWLAAGKQTADQWSIHAVLPHLTASLSCWLQELRLHSVKRMWYVLLNGKVLVLYPDTVQSQLTAVVPSTLRGWVGGRLWWHSTPDFLLLSVTVDQRLGDCRYAASPHLLLSLTIVFCCSCSSLSKAHLLSWFPPLYPSRAVAVPSSRFVWNTLLPRRTCLRKGVKTVWFQPAWPWCLGTLQVFSSFSLVCIYL